MGTTGSGTSTAMDETTFLNTGRIQWVGIQLLQRISAICIQLVLMKSMLGWDYLKASEEINEEDKECMDESVQKGIQWVGIYNAHATTNQQGENGMEGTVQPGNRVRGLGKGGTTSGCYQFNGEEGEGMD